MPEPVGASSPAIPKSAHPAAAAAASASSGAAGPTPVGLPELGAVAPGASGAGAIGILDDVTLQVRIELGRTRMLVEDVLRLNSDSVVELDKAAGDPVDVFVNGRRIARGEVLVLNDNFCVRVSEILASDD